MKERFEGLTDEEKLVLYGNLLLEMKEVYQHHIQHQIDAVLKECKQLAGDHMCGTIGVIVTRLFSEVPSQALFEEVKQQIKDHIAKETPTVYILGKENERLH